jgi:hypothetical protein
VGPRAGLGVVENVKISCPSRESNTVFSAVQPVAQLLYRLLCLGPVFTGASQSLNRCQWLATPILYEELASVTDGNVTLPL